jgi:hypothetical protein
MVNLYDTCDQTSDFCHQQLLRKMRRKISWVYEDDDDVNSDDTEADRQSRQTVVYQASSPDEVNSFYTPAPRRGRGVYCFTSVRLSFRLSKIFFRRIYLSNSDSCHQ